MFSHRRASSFDLFQFLLYYENIVINHIGDEDYKCSSLARVCGRLKIMGFFNVGVVVLVDYSI